MPQILINNCTKEFQLRVAKGFWGGLFFVLFAETLVVIAFYCFDWTWLRSAQVTWMDAILSMMGCNVHTFNIGLAVEGKIYLIDKDCTYIDLILGGMPLLWRFYRKISTNIALMAAFATTIVIVNVTRVVFAVYVTANGGSWFWTHDMVDYLLWYPALGLISIGWMRSLSQRREEEAVGI